MGTEGIKKRLFTVFVLNEPFLCEVLLCGIKEKRGGRGGVGGVEGKKTLCEVCEMLEMQKLDEVQGFCAPAGDSQSRSRYNCSEERFIIVVIAFIKDCLCCEIILPCVPSLHLS